MLLFSIKKKQKKLSSPSASAEISLKLNLGGVIFSRGVLLGMSDQGSLVHGDYRYRSDRESLFGGVTCAYDNGTVTGTRIPDRTSPFTGLPKIRWARSSTSFNPLLLVVTSLFY